MTQDDLIDVISAELKGLSNYFVPIDYENGINTALYETGWSFPLASSFQIYWLKTRTKRHMFFMLLSESAHKFKYEQINLQHRFDHYYKLTALMDEQFKEIMAERPDEFINALGLVPDGHSISELFGTKVDAGFSYDGAGKDITYELNDVSYTPKVK